MSLLCAHTDVSTIFFIKTLCHITLGRLYLLWSRQADANGEIYNVQATARLPEPKESLRTCPQKERSTILRQSQPQFKIQNLKFKIPNPPFNIQHSK